MKGIKKIIVFMICICMLCQNSFMANAKETTTQEEEGNQGVQEGKASDITFSLSSTPVGIAGGTIAIPFTVSAGKNVNITSVYPEVNDSFPFETNGDAYKVTTTNGGQSVACNYNFTVREDAATGYAPVNFMITYTIGDAEYQLSKAINTKLTAKKASTAAEVAAGSDADVTLAVGDTPTGTYDQSMKLSFTVKANSGVKIKSVTPVIADTFPFESNKEAYKVVKSSKGTKSLKCIYTMHVRSDVVTGYAPASFAIEYEKDNTKYTINKTVNIKLTGKKADGTGDSKSGSTPRLMVTGYDADKEQIKSGETFKLTIHVKNTAKKAVSNIKYALTTANGEFLPVSGASTYFIDSLAAGASTDMVFDMEVAGGLEPKSYVVTVKSDYEDSKGTAFTGEDSISIPVSQNARISVTELSVSPETIAVGEQGTVSFALNNLGSAALCNVRVNFEGEGISSEETFVGNVEAGSTGYVDGVVTGDDVTTGDGEVKAIITYEDASGKESTYEQEFNLFVSEMAQEPELSEEDMQMMEEGENPGPGIGVWIAGIIGVLVIVGIIVLVVLKKRKKRKLEEELMEDELS